MLKKYAPFLIFIAATLWATDAPFRFLLTQELPANFIVLAEHFINVLILLPLVFWVWPEIKKLTSKEWAAVIVIGVGGSALALLAFTKAFEFMNPSVAIVLQKLQPFIAIGLAVGLLREKLGKHFWLWSLLAIFGAYIISFPNLIPQVYEGEVFNPHVIGVLLALTAAVLWGASTVFGRYMLKKTSFKALTVLRFMIAFVFLLALNLRQGTIPVLSDVSGKTWLFIVIVGIVSGAVSLLIYYRGLVHTKASIATIAELGFVAMALVVNAIFIPDGTLNWVQMAGVVIILFAVYQLSKVNRGKREAIEEHA